MGADLKQVLIPEEQLKARIGELAAQIDADYAGRDLLLIGVLKGAVMVMADLARAMHLPVRDGLDGGLVLRLGHQVLGRGPDPQGPGHGHHRPARADRRGHRRLRADPVLAGGQPALAQARVAQRVRHAAQAGVGPDAVDVAYIGFDIADEFVIGYGLDYAQRYRNLPFIGTLAPAVYGGS